MFRHRSAPLLSLRCRQDLSRAGIVLRGELKILSFYCWRWRSTTWTGQCTEDIVKEQRTINRAWRTGCTQGHARPCAQIPVLLVLEALGRRWQWGCSVCVHLPGEQNIAPLVPAAIMSQVSLGALLQITPLVSTPTVELNTVTDAPQLPSGWFVLAWEELPVYSFQDRTSRAEHFYADLWWGSLLTFVHGCEFMQKLGLDAACCSRHKLRHSNGRLLCCFKPALAQFLACSLAVNQWEDVVNIWWKVLCFIQPSPLLPGLGQGPTVNQCSRYNPLTKYSLPSCLL